MIMNSMYSLRFIYQYKHKRRFIILNDRNAYEKLAYLKVK